MFRAVSEYTALVMMYRCGNLRQSGRFAPTSRENAVQTVARLMKKRGWAVPWELLHWSFDTLSAASSVGSTAYRKAN